MDSMANPWRGTGLPAAKLNGAPAPGVDAEAPAALLGRCPAAGETPIIRVDGLGDGRWTKDEHQGVPGWLR